MTETISRNVPPEQLASASTAPESPSEFARGLRQKLEPFHQYNPSAPRPSVRHVLRSLRNRELGHVNNGQPDCDAFHALLYSDTRDYRPTTWRRKFHGNAYYQNRKVVHAKTRSMYSVETKHKRQLELRRLRPEEKVVATLLSPGYFPVEATSCPNWLLVLTDMARFLVYNFVSGEQEYAYRLPTTAFDPSEMAWNNGGQDVCITGLSKDRSKFQIVVFDLFPMRFKTMFKLESRVFGDFSQVELYNEILTIHYNSPKRLVSYSFDEIFAECYEGRSDHESDEKEYSSGSRVVPFNLHIRKEPRPIRKLKEKFHTVDFSYSHPNLALLETKPEQFTLLYIIDDDLGPRNADVKIPVRKCEFDVEVVLMTFHPDNSRRLLRFEDSHLACYNVESLLNGTSAVEVRLDWRTALKVPDRSRTPADRVPQLVTTRSGRQSHVLAPLHPADEDNYVTVRVLAMKCNDDVLTLVVAYDVANLDTCSNLLARPESDWVTLVFLLDSVSGRIIRIVPVNNCSGTEQLKAGVFEVSADLDDELLVCETDDRKDVYVEKYILMEPGQRDEETPPPVPKRPVRVARKRGDDHEWRMPEPAFSKRR